MNGTRVRVRRERPTALAWALALAVTMLAVYVLTLTAALPEPARQTAAAPRVARALELPPLEGWCVTLGGFPTPDEARMAAAGYAGSGAAALVYRSEQGWQVLGAQYDTQKQAERVAARLRDSEGIDAGVLRLSAEGLRLRITAPEDRVEAIAEAAALLKAQAGQLQALAAQLDRGELQPEAARTLCALAATEAGHLSARLSPGDDPLCAALSEALDRLSLHLDEIARSREPLPGMLRRAGLDDLLQLMTLYESAGRM